jgi:hypothetical protein
MQRLLKAVIVVLAIGHSVVIGMQQTGSIRGRVVDANGTVVANARVMAGLIQYREGRRTFVQSATAQPDASGHYLLTSLAPGEYYIRLVDPLGQRGAVAYYPGSADPEHAQVIPVRAGQEILGIDFAVPNLPMFKVSGKVLNIPATLAPVEPAGSVPSLSFAPADPNNPDAAMSPLIPNVRRGTVGEFELSLPPGLWDIFPVLSTRAPRGGAAAPQIAGLPGYATGRTRVLVKDRDLEDVTITMGSADVKGRVVVEGPPDPQLAARTVTLRSLDNTPTALTSHLRAKLLEPDGTFMFPAVPPGKYLLMLSSLWEGFYVADFRLGSTSFYADGAFEVGITPLELIEIILRQGGGRVTVNAIGPNDGAFVLAPANRQNVALYKVLTASLSSSFVDVAPGEYKVFAFLRFPGGGAEQNAAFLSQYERFGVPVRVIAGETVNAEVQWTPADSP